MKAAYLRVEQEHELNLHNDRVPPAKTIFALSNFGWKNPQYIEQKVTVEKDGAAALASNLLGGGESPSLTASEQGTSAAS